MNFQILILLPKGGISSRKSIKNNFSVSRLIYSQNYILRYESKLGIQIESKSCKKKTHNRVLYMVNQMKIPTIVTSVQEFVDHNCTTL